MKTNYVVRTVLSALSMVVVPGVLPAQTAAQGVHIVHYESASEKMPDFQKTLVAINLNGSPAEEAKSLFIKKHGVRAFAEGGNNPCLAGRDIICLWSERPSNGVPINSSSASSYSGNRGGVNSWNSGYGEEYFVTLHLDLYTVDHGGNYHITQLAVVTAGGFAGQTSDYISSSDQHGSGYFSTTVQTPEEIAIAVAMHNAVVVLLDKHFWRGFFNPNTHAQWFPGAADAVQEAFGQ